MGPVSDKPGSTGGTGARAGTSGRLPLVGHVCPAPVAAKVPEVIFVFWVVKILTTAGGEATSDFLKNWGNVRGGGTEVLVFVVGLLLQFGTGPWPTGPWLLPSPYPVRVFPISSISTFIFPMPVRRCCGRWYWPRYFGSGNAARARYRSTASRPSAAKSSTGQPYSQPLPSGPLSGTSRRPH